MLNKTPHGMHLTAKKKKQTNKQKKQNKKKKQVDSFKVASHPRRDNVGKEIYYSRKIDLLLSLFKKTYSKEYYFYQKLWTK